MTKEKDALPNDNIFSRDVLCLSVLDFTIHACRVEGRRYPQNDVGSGELVVEVCFQNDDVRDLRRPDLVHRRDDLQWKFNVRSRSIPMHHRPNHEPSVQ